MSFSYHASQFQSPITGLVFSHIKKEVKYMVFVEITLGAAVFFFGGIITVHVIRVVMITVGIIAVAFGDD